MLDDQNVLKQRDPHGALHVASTQWLQAAFEVKIEDADHDGRHIERIVVAGMGGSALAALLIKDWLGATLPIPIDVVRDYDLPGYVNEATLVVASSYSGNTEETLSALQQARERNAQIGIAASGGALIDRAREASIAHVVLPGGIQPRMAMIYNLRGVLALLVHFGALPQSVLDDVAAEAQWLHRETAQWIADVPTDKNEAKQLALLGAGKTPVFYAGPKTASLAYKWKISWNETAKNVAFWNQYSEFNHNEFMGWVSHPIEKPFAIFDLISQLEHPQVLKRFEISDRLLSGMRPKANVVHLKGNNHLQQLLRGCILADFASIYAAVLNGVDPVPVDLIEKLKKELV